MQPTDRRIVFIGGLHRSGTSLLHRAVGAHPSISFFKDTGAKEDEGQLLQSVYPPASRYGGPGRFGFHPDAYMDESHALATAANAERLLAEWSRYWNMEAPLLVEKSPPNLIHTRFLQALFPNCFFIILLRHPVAVACATEKWAPREGLGRLLEHWVICHEAFEADRPHLRRVTTVRYEDLVSSPGVVLERLWDFLELEPIPVEEPVRTGINDKYFRQWLRRRRGLFSRWSIRRAVDRLESRVQPFGYSLREPEGAAS